MDCKLLENIKSPSDLKKLDEKQLPLLASEVREKIISTVSENGGHLASNLGVVELTIALHRVFNSPNDKIIWDVGHQVYTHKLLTGRFGDFDTLRKKDGLSGFSRPNESEHDIVFSGHSSTSVSTALGIAAANAVNGKKDYAIAVLGDGALTGGLIYEAINNAGRMKDARLIIILNDNGMSISKNVGHLAKSLAVMRSRTGYFKLKAMTEKVISKIPLIGKPLATKLFKLKTDVKNMLYQSNFFEDFGVRYMGPIDGHNIEQLCDALEGAKAVNSPVILHVNTIKGKGYVPAEQNPSAFHGVGAFDRATGETKKSKDSFSEKFGEFFYNQAAKDKRICAITAAMSLGTGLKRFSEEYKDRFFDVGIAEEHAIPYALGLAKGGMLPVFVVYSTFLQRCFDQLMHDCALQNVKMIIAVDRAGIVGDDGETHNGIYDPAFFNGIPNITVFSPSYYAELNKDFVAALYHIDGPVAVRYPRGAGILPDMPDCFEPLKIGRGRIVREGNRVAILSLGTRLEACLNAADMLALEGISATVADARFAKPFDEKLLRELVEGHRALAVVEEGVQGGFGASVMMWLANNGLLEKTKVRFLTMPDVFVEQASMESQYAHAGLDARSIADAVAAMVE